MGRTHSHSATDDDDDGDADNDVLLKVRALSSLTHKWSVISAKRNK